MRKVSTPDRWGLAVYVMVRDRRGRVLMLRRSQTVKHFPGYWELPGGKPAPGEHFYKTAELEVVEETGLCVTPCGVAGAAEGSIPGLRVAMLILEALIPKSFSSEVTLSHEHDTYSWLPLTQVGKLRLRPGFDRFFVNWRKSNRRRKVKTHGVLAR